MTYQKDPRVDEYIDALPEWQQDICQQVRDLVHAVDPEVVETIKRRVQPYFVLQGNICALLAAKDHVNVFLYDGTIVPDPEGIITAGHDNKTGRMVSIRQNEKINTPRSRGDVPADHRQQPRRRMAQDQTGSPNGYSLGKAAGDRPPCDPAANLAARRGESLRRQQGTASPAPGASPVHAWHPYGRPGGHGRSFRRPGAGTRRSGAMWGWRRLGHRRRDHRTGGAR